MNSLKAPSPGSSKQLLQTAEETTASLAAKGISRDAAILAVVQCVCVCETGQFSHKKKIELDALFNTTSPC